MAEFERKEEDESARQRFEGEKPPDLETKVRLETLADVGRMEKKRKEGIIKKELEEQSHAANKVASNRRLNSPDESEKIRSTISDNLSSLGSVNICETSNSICQPEQQHWCSYSFTIHYRRKRERLSHTLDNTTPKSWGRYNIDSTGSSEGDSSGI